MSRSDQQRRRAERKANERLRLKTKLARLKEIVRLGDGFPQINEFIQSLDLSPYKRLLGIFTCSAEDYLATAAILEKNAHSGYQTLQGEIDGDGNGGGDGKGRGWTAPVKQVGDPDDTFRIFIGIVSHQLSEDDKCKPTDGWLDIVSVVHELGHAYDMDKGVIFHLGQPFIVEDAEVVAHDFACRLLREHGLTMGLVAYLSAVICSMVKENAAARRFLISDEYRRCFELIPRLMRKQFNIIEPT